MRKRQPDLTVFDNSATLYWYEEPKQKINDRIHDHVYDGYALFCLGKTF